MPPEPQDPHASNISSGKPEGTSKPAPIDPKDLLLPQKEVRKVESDSRVSAGILLDQEQTAAKEGIQNPSALPKTPTPVPPKPPVNPSEIKPLQTYQSDIESVMQSGNASMVSIAAAEAQRRAQKGHAELVPEEPSVPLKDRLLSFVKSSSMILVGVALLVVAVAALSYLYLRPTTVPVAAPPNAPFISVDEAHSVVLQPTEPPRNLILKLDNARKQVSLALGLIERIVPAVSSTTADGDALTAMTAQTFLSAIAPNIPNTLLRAVSPQFLLGVHVYDSNQPFLIFKTESYQDGFAGMLAWEYSMKQNLTPLFNYTPREHIPEENIPLLQPVTGTSTATSTASTTPVSTPASAPAPVAFVDKIVENHDARVLQNEYGDIYLMWMYLDRTTLLITTNAATLREIISRLQNASVTQTPTQ